MAKKTNSDAPTASKGRARWLGWTFFISLWMFVLGILVGRGTVPVTFDVEKLENELAELKQAVTQMEYRRFKLDSQESGIKQDLDFYEALKEGHSGSGIKSTLPGSKPAAAPKKTVTKKRRSVKPKPAPAARKPVEIPAPQTQSAAPPRDKESRKHLTIQVSASKDAKVADRLVERLKKKGYPAYRTIAKIPGQGIWYRVRIGRFSDKKEASGTLSRLQREKFKAILVNR